MPPDQSAPTSAALSHDQGAFIPDAAVFGGDPPVDAAGLLDQWLGELGELRHAGRDDPLTNPVLALGRRIARGLADGSLTPGGLEQVIQYVSAEGFLERAGRLSRYLGETDPDANRARLEELFDGLAERAGDFDAFAKELGREVFGVVFTAHPTFNLHSAMMADLAAIAAGRRDDGQPLSDGDGVAIVQRASRTEHRSDPDISLMREHALSMEALRTLQEALREVYRIALGVARQRWPDRWRELTPRLITAASWVGYDLDGRSDIRWTDTLVNRLILQVYHLRGHLAALRPIQAELSGDPSLTEPLELMDTRIAFAIAQLEDEVAAFGACDPGDPGFVERIRQISRRVFEGRARRITHVDGLVELVDRVLDRLAPERHDVAARLCILRAELRNYGLGLAHTHVRINATQVHNAIRKQVELVSDVNDPRFRRSYLDRVEALLDGVQPVTINFGSLIAERTSTKQLFMVLAQMLKYSDSTAPLRFLIAECESAFTPLTALYFARLFGVADQIDISPLFETERALEAGSRVIEQLLESPHYRAYLEARGRLCIQTGYSDAGRYLGQTAAAASIERLRFRIVRALADHGMAHVELVVFDTHGESIGRGAHPGSFAARLAYTDPAAFRAAAARFGVRVKQEVSFQGGDGYVPFLNPATALAVLTRVLEHAQPGAPVPASDDPFYAERAYIREFFTTVKGFQDDLVDDPNYGVLLTTFGANLLFPSGSRALKRQHEEPAEADAAHASQIRAIPHNAILMQLGLLANSLGGLGAAVDKDPERFRMLYDTSERFRRVMGIGEFAVAVSDPQVMEAYITVTDPAWWVRRTAAEPHEDSERLLTIARHLRTDLHERQRRVFLRLFQDFTELDRALEDLGEAPRSLGCAGLISERSRRTLLVLHAMRLAIIQQIYVLAVQIPDFSSRHAVTRRQLVDRLFHLDVPSVVTLLEEIFPQDGDRIRVEDFGEPADYRPDDAQSYRLENDLLFRPLAAYHRLCQRISTAVAHRHGFFG
ncbi:MAG: phosphoenolpyruvate carboxylase [Rhodospirillaceae bacterium]|nr:phosphoenolpyruvate carboxylase [Rhodospirillaceae bacterium]